MPAHSALDKLAAAVPSMHQLRAQHARGRLLFDTKPWFRSLRRFAVPRSAAHAALEGRPASTSRYERSNGEHRDYRVEPYALVVKVDTWYLIGRVKREMRVFRISRIQTLAPTGETFTRDADFDLQKFWKRWCERFESNPPPRNFAVEL